MKASLQNPTEPATALIRQQRPALVVVDRRLGPDGTGTDVLQLLQDDPELRHIPMILCTADLAWLADNAAHLRALGCHVLPKPFDLDDLLALVAPTVGPGQPGQGAGRGASRAGDETNVSPLPVP